MCKHQTPHRWFSGKIHRCQARQTLKFDGPRVRFTVDASFSSRGTCNDRKICHTVIPVLIIRVDFNKLIRL